MPGDGPTRIADIVTPSVYIPYFLEEMKTKSNLIRSGIVQMDPRLDVLASAGGTLVNIPFFKELSGDDEVLTSGTGASDSDLTVYPVSTAREIAALLTRGKAWGAEDLAAAIAGSDPLGAIADMAVQWWSYREQAALIKTIEGNIAANAACNSSDLIEDISSSDSSAASTSISANAIVDAAAKMGDSSMELGGLVVHSKIHACMQKQNLITFEPTSAQDLGFGTYLGKSLIVDDACPKSGTASTARYYSYLFKPGAFLRGEGSPPVPVETDRDSLAGVDILIHRRHFILHPRGYRFRSSSVAGDTPTNTELGTASNWKARVSTSAKQCGVVALRTNAIYP